MRDTNLGNSREISKNGTEMGSDLRIPTHRTEKTPETTKKDCPSLEAHSTSKGQLLDACCAGTCSPLASIASK